MLLTLACSWMPPAPSPCPVIRPTPSIRAASNAAGAVAARRGRTPSCVLATTVMSAPRRTGWVGVDAGVRRVRRHGGVVAPRVLLEVPAVDDVPVDVEPRVLGVAPLELVRADDAARAQALDLQRLPDQYVLVVGAGRQHQQAAGGRAVDRVLERWVVPSPAVAAARSRPAGCTVRRCRPCPARAW